jgi:dTDP-4-dehydrorhamnose reductase
MIAEATAIILAKRPLPPGEGWGEGGSGLYHLTAAGSTSWHGFARAILDESARLPLIYDLSWPSGHGKSESRSSGTPRPSPGLIPIPTAAYPAPAGRPPNSVMSNQKLLARFGLALPSWDKALSLCMEDMWPANW